MEALCSGDLRSTVFRRDRMSPIALMTGMMIVGSLLGDQTRDRSAVLPLLAEVRLGVEFDQAARGEPQRCGDRAFWLLRG